MITCVIIDDEKKAREVMVSSIETYCVNISIQGTAETVEEGIELISQKNPDLVFLDINMHGKDGFDILDFFEVIDFEVILVTAHDNYAIKAFKHNAVDYILKPVDPKELLHATKKVEEKIIQKKNSEIYNDIRNLQAPHKKIGLPSRDGMVFVSLSDVIRCESDANYTYFHFINGSKILTSKTLKEFESVLHEYNFIRVHKSHLINLNHIRSYKKGQGGMVTMIDNSEIEVSKRNKDSLLQKMKI